MPNRRIRRAQRHRTAKFIDLEKAYDSIPREEIWRSSRERNVPEKYITVIQVFGRRRSGNAPCGTRCRYMYHGSKEATNDLFSGSSKQLDDVYDDKL